MTLVKSGISPQRGEDFPADIYRVGSGGNPAVDGASSRSARPIDQRTTEQNIDEIAVRARLGFGNILHGLRISCSVGKILDLCRDLPKNSETLRIPKCRGRRLRFADGLRDIAGHIGPRRDPAQTSCREAGDSQEQCQFTAYILHENHCPSSVNIGETLP